MMPEYYAANCTLSVDSQTDGTAVTNNDGMIR